MASRFERIVGTLHGGSKIFTANTPLSYTSSDQVVLRTAGTAFAPRVDVNVETFSLKSRVIERIKAFDVSSSAPIALRRIARLATQWKPLENRHVPRGVHPRRRPFPNQYFALDPLIQEVCCAAAWVDTSIEYDVEDRNLVVLVSRTARR